MANLVDLGAFVVATGGDGGGPVQEVLTPLGFQLAMLSVEPHMGKMLVYAAIFNALGDLPVTEYRPTERERQRVRDHNAVWGPFGRN